MHYDDFLANKTEHFTLLQCRKLNVDLDRTVDPERIENLQPEFHRPLLGIRLIQSEKLLVTTEELRLKRQEAVDKTRYLDKQWDELASKEKTLKKSFITYSKFVETTKHKINREKLKSEQSQIKIKDLEIKCEEMRRKIKYLMNIKSIFSKETDKLRLYEVYLDDCVPYFDLRCVTEIINRYISLQDARDSLDTTTKNHTKKTAKLSRENRNLVTTLKYGTVRYSEIMTALFQKYEEVHLRVKKWENILYSVNEQLRKRWQEIMSTHETLGYITCVLLKKMAMKMPPGKRLKKSDILTVLSTNKGKSTFLKIFFGHLEKLNEKLRELWTEREEPEKVLEIIYEGQSGPENSSYNAGTSSSGQTSEDEKKKRRVTLPPKRKLVFPKLSPVTEDLLTALIEEEKEREMKAKMVDAFSMKSSKLRSMEGSGFKKIVKKVIYKMPSIRSRDVEAESMRNRSTYKTLPKFVTLKLDPLNYPKKNEPTNRIIEKQFSQHERKYRSAALSKNENPKMNHTTPKEKSP